MNADPVATAAEHAEAARRHVRARDEAIRAAVAAGVSLRAVGEACGLSHTAIRQIAGRRPDC